MPLPYTRFALAFLAIIAISTASGCGSNSADGLIKQQISLMNDIADDLEAGKMDAMQTYQPRMEEIATKLKDLELSADEMNRLREKYKEPIQEVAQRVQKALMSKMPSMPGMPSMPNMPSMPAMPR